MRAKAALDKGDSLAAMEAYAKLAARKEQARPSDAEEEKPRVALLNETSFDRRRQVAVYKNDGKRGHHMQVRCPSTSQFSPNSPSNMSCFLGPAQEMAAVALVLTSRTSQDCSDSWSSISRHARCGRWALSLACIHKESFWGQECTDSASSCLGKLRGPSLHGMCSGKS